MKRQEKDSRDKLIEYKKTLFLGAVEDAANYLGFPTPRINFWEVYDSSHFDKGERAHIHLENQTICISEAELEIMSEEDINETARHEVTHLRNASHDSGFHNLKDEVSVSTWKPPRGTGIVAIEESEGTPKEEKKTKKKKITPNRKECYNCRKKCKTFLCPYCGMYFCTNHVNPREPYFGSRPQLEEKNTHPCFGYANHLQEEKEREDEEYQNKLKDIFAKKHNEEIDPRDEVNRLAREKIKRYEEEMAEQDEAKQGAEEEYTPIKDSKGKSSIWCKMGIHKWTKVLSHSIIKSHVIDHERHCLRCGKKERWSEPN